MIRQWLDRTFGPPEPPRKDFGDFGPGVLGSTGREITSAYYAAQDDYNHQHQRWRQSWKSVIWGLLGGPFLLQRWPRSK